MSKFTSPNGVLFSVDDSKDDRYKDVAGFEPTDALKTPAKRAASKSSK